MRSFIVVNAYTSFSGELHQPKRLKEELGRLGVEAEIVRNSPKVLQREADFCVYLDKDKYAALALEKRMRLFNRARAIELCDDKMLTYLTLDGYPMPETIPSLLCYTPDAPVSEELLSAAEKLGFPLVVKECFGSLGRQVYLVKTFSELEEISERLKGIPHLYQRFIAESAGRDLRVIAVGGEIVACMERRSEHDFRSNVGLGGHGTPFSPDEELRTLIRGITERLGLDYCGADLLFGKDGYLVCEVNSNAFFGGIEEVTGVNVARAYAEHMLASL